MKKLLYALLGLTILMTSCDTIENRAELGSVVTKDQLKITLIQKTSGANTISLVNNTSGAIMYWDWGSGNGHSSTSGDTVTFVQPFKGTFKLKYTALCAGGTITDSTTFTTAANDDAYFNSAPAWKSLTNGGVGQTWVIATDANKGVIAGNGPENCTTPGWWTMRSTDLAGQLKGSWNLNDEVYMDLNGAANFQVKHDDGSVTKGFFLVINDYVNGGVNYPAISVSGGAKFPWPDGNGVGKYHFTVMNANELSVHDFGGFNICMYKRKGFSY